MLLTIKHMLFLCITLSTVLVGYAQIPSPIRVVLQIGDSYASGNGASNYSGVDGCYRSPSTWGARFAQSINASYINRGCSGGLFADIPNDRNFGEVSKSGGTCPISPNAPEEFYTNTGNSTCNRLLQAQKLSVNTSVDLILFAMGANDFQYKDIVSKCLIFGLRNASDCQDQINFVRSYAATWTQTLTNVLLSFNLLLKPTARVIVIQYPHIVLNTPFTFSEPSGPSIEITNQLRSLGTVFDDSQRSAVAAANQAANRQFVIYYDQIKTLFEGHEIHPSFFEDNPNAWVYAVIAPDIADTYHLNPTGHVQLGTALNQFVKSSTPPVPVPIAAPIKVPAPVPISIPIPRPVPAPTTVISPPVPVPVPPSPSPRRNGLFQRVFRFFFGWLL